MKTKQIWGNLAVSNVAKTRKFFLDLGFKLNKGYDGGDELCTILFGEDEFVINFFLKERLRTFMENEIADVTKVNEIMFSLSAETQEKVDEWAKKVEAAGGDVFSNTKGNYGNVWL